MKWQSIETAPKDGSLIILGWVGSAEDHEDGYEAVSLPGRWQQGVEDGVDYMGQDDGFVDCNYQFFIPPRTTGPEAYRYSGRQPTHWQPLPQPPNGEDA